MSLAVRDWREGAEQRGRRWVSASIFCGHGHRGSGAWAAAAWAGWFRRGRVGQGVSFLLSPPPQAQAGARCGAGDSEPWAGLGWCCGPGREPELSLVWGGERRRGEEFSLWSRNGFGRLPAFPPGPTAS